VNVCVAAGRTPLLAVMVNVNGEPVLFGGVPVMVAEFPPKFVRVAHEGNPVPTLNVAAGEPVPLTVNVPALPAAKMDELALVITGAVCATLRRIVWLTVSAI
jgi:hypothetical protein